MTLSATHFRLIARVLRASRPEAFPVAGEDPITPWEQWQETVERMTTALATTNDRFDVARFKRACGLEIE